MKRSVCLWDSNLLSARFRRKSRKHIPHFWLAMMTVSAMALFLPCAAYAQRCTGNINTGCTNPGAVCKPVESGTGPTGHCVTPGGLPPGERECRCAGTIPPPPPLLDPGCGNRAITGKINCTIDQPNVTQHETTYPSVLFAPGDIVEATADGCVQTGGLGNTWKRYLNPSGPNSVSLYHGLIRIPTGTKDSALVRINTVIGRELTVTGIGVPTDQLMLHLGYEDDDYSDNGYYAHDDGTEDQCKQGGANDGGPAHVTITIYRGVKPDTPTSRFDWDVLSTSKPDPNGLPYNPLWNWQLQPQNQGQKPNTSMCHNFSRRGSDAVGIPDAYMSPYFADCTDQADLSTVDLPVDPNSIICKVSWPPRLPYTDDTFAGHVNWFPITIEGHGGWGDHGPDDDYTFTYDSDGQSNPLSVNDRSGMHVEFDSDETIDHFSSTEWQAFHTAVDNSQSAKVALDECNNNGAALCTQDQITALQKTIDYPKTLFNGHTILTGMFGLDGEHNLKSELHPVYALATLRDNYENDPSDEVWLMFVRNEGDEGFCSSQIWDAGFEDYTVKLPWHADKVAVEVNWDKTQFVGTDGTSGPTVSVMLPPSPDAGVYVSFHLGPAVLNSSLFGTPASVPFLNGALHLVWLVAQANPGTPARTGALAACKRLIQSFQDSFLPRRAELRQYLKRTTQNRH